MAKNLRIKRLVKAVREDPYLGKDTGSYIDETYTNRELSNLIGDIVHRREVKGESTTVEDIVEEVTWLENLWRQSDDPISFPQIKRRKSGESLLNTQDKLFMSHPEELDKVYQHIGKATGKEPHPGAVIEEFKSTYPELGK